MAFDVHPAAENIRRLEQGIRLVRWLGDAAYAHGARGSFRGGVGSQFRHCIDFYTCFLDGLDRRTVDYAARGRDRRIETDRHYAAERAEEVVRRLSEARQAPLDDALRVRADDVPPGAEAAAWSRSTVHRELQFLASHTIHHHALIVALLAQQGIELPEGFDEFGVAPSTAQHWKEADSLAT